MSTLGVVLLVAAVAVVAYIAYKMVRESREDEAAAKAAREKAKARVHERTTPAPLSSRPAANTSLRREEERRTRAESDPLADDYTTPLIVTSLMSEPTQESAPEPACEPPSSFDPVPSPSNPEPTTYCPPEPSRYESPSPSYDSPSPSSYDSSSSSSDSGSSFSSSD